MKAWLKQLSDNLNFTPTERAVVLTLIGAFIVGLGIRLFRGNDPARQGFDYAAVDSEFAAKSAAPVPGAGGGRPAGGDAGMGRADSGGAATHPAVSGTAAAERGGRARAPSRIDLNHATKSDLMALPGVGEVIADRILLYREERGGFAGVDDLLKVRGIGKKKLERIAPFCYVEK